MTKRKPRVSFSYSSATMFFSYNARCFLCGAAIPAKTVHRCSSVKKEKKRL